MNPRQAKKEFENGIENLSGKYRKSEIFTDFLDYIVYLIRTDKADKQIERLQQRYSDEEFREFIRLFELLGSASLDYYDALGDFFMEYVSMGHNGQFFTPDSICKLLARMTMDENTTGAISDPAAGAGRTLLAAASINPHLEFVGADLDPNCVKMCLINFWMNSLNGWVVCMNTLTMDVYQTWRVRRLKDTDGYYIPYCYQVSRPEEAVIQSIKVKAEAKQLNLFEI